MLTHGRPALALLLTLFLVFGLATVAQAAETLPRPQNIRNASSNDPQKVTLTWTPGLNQPGDGQVHLLERYIVKRDGRVLDRLEAVNGVAPLSYTDTPPDGDHTYEVIARYVGEGFSEPAVLELTTNAAAEPVEDNRSETNLSTGYCGDIKTRDLIGSNQPTPFEIYGCTPPLTSLPDKYSTGLSLLGKPKDIGRQVQAGYLNDMISFGTVWHLTGSSVLSWALDASTYDAIMRFGEKMIVAIQGSPIFTNWVVFGSALFLVGISLLLMRGRLWGAIRAIVISAFAVFLLSALLLAPFKFIQYAVQPPMFLTNSVMGSAEGFTAGSAESQNYNFSVRPTYNGDRDAAVMRKTIYRRWVIERYYPWCTKVFGDLEFSTKTFMPGTRITWCEGAIKAHLTGDDEKVKEYEQALEEANPKARKFYGGGDISKRTVLTVVHEVSSFFNTSFILLYVVIIMIAMALLVFDMLRSVILLPVVASALPSMLSLAYRLLNGIGGKWENAVLAAFGILLMMTGQALWFFALAPFGPLVQQIVMNVFTLMVFLTLAGVWWMRRRRRRERHRALGGSTPAGNAVGRVGRIAGQIALQSLSFGAGSEAARRMFGGAEANQNRKPMGMPSASYSRSADDDALNGVFAHSYSHGGPPPGNPGLSSGPAVFDGSYTEVMNRQALPVGGRDLPPGGLGGSDWPRHPDDPPPSNGRGGGRPALPSGGGTYVDADDLELRPELPRSIEVAVDAPDRLDVEILDPDPIMLEQVSGSTGGRSQAATLDERGPASSSPGWRPPPSIDPSSY